jgi:hypothetical protein
MIIIKCCATCRYWSHGICMDRESYEQETSEDMWCPEWEEYKDAKEKE